MDDPILSLSGLELRKAVAKAKGYTVQTLTPEDKAYGLVDPQGYFCGSWSWDEERCWKDAPKYESHIGDSFPLVLEMRDLGWNTTINCIHDAYGEKTMFVYVVDDDHISDSIEVYSESDTDPSDAIAIAYLLVRKKMGL